LCFAQFYDGCHKRLPRRDVSVYSVTVVRSRVDLRIYDYEAAITGNPLISRKRRSAPFIFAFAEPYLYAEDVIRSNEQFVKGSLRDQSF
jgi:hypothetical protein